MTEAARLSRCPAASAGARTARAALAAGAMLGSIFAAAGCAPQAAGDLASLYARVRRASVAVLAEGHLVGSGWFADANGHVVTAAHAVRQRSGALEVLSPALGRLAASLVAVDVGNDLALLRARAAAGRAEFLEIADAVPAVGQEVFVFGAAQFRHGQFMRGCVSRSEAGFEYYPDQRKYVRVYYVAGNGPHGLSGGCWVDRRGLVVGVQSGMMTHRQAAAGLTYAVPPDAVRRLVATRRSAVTPTLGLAVEELWERPAGFIRRFPAGTRGLVSVIVHPGGPADRAKMHKQMVITAVDGRPVEYRDEFLRRVRSRKPGEEITLRVVEPDGKGPRDIRLRVGKHETGLHAGG